MILADETVRRLLAAGTSVMVGTADASGAPTCCRAVGMTPAPDPRVVVVYVPVASGAGTIANIATTRRLAVVVSDPLSHGTVQLKGCVRGVRVAPEAERPGVHGCLERLADVLGEVGLPRRLLLGLAWWPAFAVEMEVEAAFEQTPGPRAGAAMATR